MSLQNLCCHINAWYKTGTYLKVNIFLCIDRMMDRIDECCSSPRTNTLNILIVI